MSSISIYVEGGGNGKGGRAALRRGMDAFLEAQKQTAQSRGWRWKLTCAGSRNETFGAFRNATRRDQADFVLLLVDAEGPVREGPLAHLSQRDGWNIGFADEGVVHLMVETMEAWIVADAEALANYYGQGFRRSALPNAAELESVPKRDLERALHAATRRTTKGRYHKIHHASELLARISPSRVGARCDGCRRLLDFLNHTLS